MNAGILSLDRLTWAAVLVAALDIAALTSIWQSRKHSKKARVIWTLIVAVLPLFGAVAWFVLGRERQRAR